MSEEEIAKQVYAFIKNSKSYENDRDAFFLLLRRFKAAPAATASVATEGPQKVIAERTLELVDISGNADIRYSVDLASLGVEGANFLEYKNLHQVSMALRTLCTDEIARNAFKAVRVVSIKHGGGDSCVLKGDTLFITGTPNDREIYKALDDGLHVTFQRMLQRVVKEQLPTREKEILQELGVQVALRPKLETFTTPASCEFLDNVGGLRLLMAVRTVAMDPTSKQLVAAALKTVTFINVHNDSDYKIAFDPASGTLTLACQFDRLQSTAGSQLLSHYQIVEELMGHLNVRVAQKSKELKDKLIPEREAELKEILGVLVPYKVMFSTFTDEPELNFVDHVGCARVAMACRCMSGGDKEKLAQTLKSIELFNVKKEAEKSVEFDGGVLRIKNCYSTGLSGSCSDGEIKAVLTK